MRRVLVIGAGPAGLAAAVAASERGATVTVLDSADDAGGQYWRHLPQERTTPKQARLHHGWAKFTALRDKLASNGVDFVAQAQVWAIDRDDDGLRVHTLVGPVDGGRTRHTFRCDALILATGAHDRALPFPGWTLPGVYTAGAAQALAKQERVAVGERVVVSGTGPFLLPVAASLTSVGAEVTSVHEASTVRTLVRGWLSNPHRMVSYTHKFGELGGYAWGQLRHRIPYRIGEAVVKAHGTDAVTAVTVARVQPDWTPIEGTERTIEADAVCVGHGFVPRVELAVACGCELGADRFVLVDDSCQTSVAGVYAAGEITGIAGADAALIEGAIAGRRAAGAPSEPNDSKRLAKWSSFAQRLRTAHGIGANWRSWLSDDTTICRCEGVAYSEIVRTAGETQQTETTSVKLTTRAGLGICQGRTCGRTLEELLGASSRSTGTDRRPIASPIRLGELAAQSSESPHNPTQGAAS